MAETATMTVSGIGDPARLPPGQRHWVLASKRRRDTLDVLKEESQPLALPELAAAIARLERNTGQLDDETVRHLATELHHIHLPMMADCGIVSYAAQPSFGEL